MCVDSQAPPVGNMPQVVPSTGPAMRHRSVLWWATQPPQSYIVRAVLAPVTCRSFSIEKKGSVASARLPGSAIQ